MSNVGYLTYTGQAGFNGEPGDFYNYIMGSNGLFFLVRNKHLEAMIPIAGVPIRGLASIKRDIVLFHGRIPRVLYELALSILIANHLVENEILITWGPDGKYHLVKPEQKGEEAHLEYKPVANTVLDLHNHTGEQAFFSSTDDADDQGLKISMVVANIRDRPEYVMRLSAYGYFAPMTFEEVFE